MSTGWRDILITMVDCLIASMCLGCGDHGPTGRGSPRFAGNPGTRALDDPLANAEWAALSAIDRGRGDSEVLRLLARWGELDEQNAMPLYLQASRSMRRQSSGEAPDGVQVELGGAMDDVFRMVVEGNRRPLCCLRSLHEGDPLSPAGTLRGLAARWDKRYGSRYALDGGLLLLMPVLQAACAVACAEGDELAARSGNQAALRLATGTAMADLSVRGFCDAQALVDSDGIADLGRFADALRPVAHSVLVPHSPDRGARRSESGEMARLAAVVKARAVLREALVALETAAKSNGATEPSAKGENGAAESR